MNRPVKLSWLRALRSGGYEQGTGKLREGDSNAFCCLGVLCDLHRKAVGTSDWDYETYCDTDSVLPREVMEWAGLSQNNPIVRVDGDQLTLSELNDDREANFDQIADVIEKEL